MKATINGAIVEGTPEEIAKLLKLTTTPAPWATDPVIIIQPAPAVIPAPPPPYPWINVPFITWSNPSVSIC